MNEVPAKNMGFKSKMAAVPTDTIVVVAAFSFGCGAGIWHWLARFFERPCVEDDLRGEIAALRAELSTFRKVEIPQKGLEYQLCWAVLLACALGFAISELAFQYRTRGPRQAEVPLLDHYDDVARSAATKVSGAARGSSPPRRAGAAPRRLAIANDIR